MSDDRHPTVPNSALAGLLVTLTSWQLAIASLFLDGHLPTKLVCVFVGLVATLFVASVGGKAAAPYWKYGGRIVLSPMQTLFVVLYIVAFGAFGGIAFAIAAEG